MTDYTHPVIKYYAEKVGADFQVLSHISGCTHAQGKWHYRIFKHRELHEEYDRILHIDSDAIITPNCPNIFEIVPYDCIGTVYEDKGSRAADRRDRIKKAKMHFGNIDWTHGYIDTGVFLTSKFDSHIIHYAGAGTFNKSSKLEQIKSDVYRFYEGD